MSAVTPHNAISQRLDLLIRYWLDFTGISDARVCRWLLAEDEVQMIEAFRRFESSGHGRTPDLFFRINSPFESPNTFEAAATAEFRELLESDAELLRKEGHTFDWSVPDGPNPNLILLLNQLAQYLQGRIELVVLLLTPADFSDTKAWIQYLETKVQRGIPERVRIMLVDTYKQEAYADLAAAFPGLVQTIEPKLDMAGAMQEIAAMGDPEDPAVKYRKLYLEASQAAAQKDLPAMEKAVEDAKSLAASEGWFHLQVSALYLKGTTWMGENRTSQAVLAFEEAREICRSAIANGEAVAFKLMVQLYLASAAAWFNDKNWEEAATDYSEAKQFAIQSEDAFSLLEACRMHAYCLEQHGDRSGAWESLKAALEAGAQLDDSTRPNSTLPYVGQAMLRIMPRIGKDEEENTIRLRMVELAGPDWESKIVKRKGIL